MLCFVRHMSTAFCQLPASSSRCASLLDQLITKSSVDLMPYRNVLVGNLSRLLDSGVSRHCQDLVQRIWLKMNGLFSAKLVASFYPFNLSITSGLSHSRLLAMYVGNLVVVDKHSVL